MSEDTNLDAIAAGIDTQEPDLSCEQTAPADHVPAAGEMVAPEPSTPPPPAPPETPTPSPTHATSADTDGIIPTLKGDPDAPAKPRPWPDTISAADFVAKDIPTPPEMIHGVLYTGGTMMFSGASKARKSFIALDLAISVASGSAWIEFQTSPAPVIFLNFELPEFGLQKRIVEICTARGIDAPKDLHLLNLRGCAVNVGGLKANISRQIEVTGARLIVIDPYYKISAVSGGEENSNDSQAALLSDIESTITPLGAGIVVTHHFAKGNASAKNSIDRASGGGVFARWPDAIATLTEHSEEDCATLELHLRLFKPVQPIALRWEFPIWKRDGTIDPADLKKVGGRKPTASDDDVLKALGEGRKTYSEWMKASGMKDSTFDRYRKSLIEKGRVIQCGVIYNLAG